MTTIAANREMMAADSLTTIDDTRFQISKRKLHRLHQGLGNPEHLVAASGQTRHIQRFIEWYSRFRPVDERPDLDEDFAALALTPEGLYYYDGGAYPFKVEGKYWAIGSGAEFALGAMAAGANPEQAVHAALRFDVGTGPPVVVERL